MTFSATALLALIACKPGVAPLFALPPPAVTTGTLRAASVPGAVPEAQSAARLDGHAMTALFATSEALLERALFPQMTNYGPGRDVLTPTSLLTADFGWYMRERAYDGYGGPNLWNFIGYAAAGLEPATNRDFSATGTRLGKVYDLFKTVMGIPDSGASTLIRLDLNDLTWLDPEIALAGEAPTGEWVMDDETQTANWQRYLMTLNERKHDDITSFAKCPFYNLMGITVKGLPVLDWEGYMTDGGFPTLDDFMYENFGPHYECVNGSVRGNKQPPLSELLKKVAHVSSVSNLWARDLRRVRRDQFALANAIAGSCHVLYDKCSPVTSYYGTNKWEAGYSLPYERGPLYRFLQERVTGTVSATLTLKGEGQGLQFGHLDYEMPTRYGFGALFDADKLETVSFSNEVSAAYSTQTVDVVTAAWRDENGIFGVGLTATAPVNADGIHLDNTDIINADAPSGDYPLFWVREVVPNSVSHSLYVKVDRGNGNVDVVNVGHMGWPGESCWTSSVTVAYSASFNGAETVRTKTPFYGPTFMDRPSIPKDVDESECSLMGVGYHPMFYDSGILRSADMHAFACCGVSTNAKTIARVAVGGAFAWSDPDKDVDTVKDTWAYFKGSVLHSGLADRKAVRSAFERAYDNTMKDAVSTCADKVPGDYEQPVNRSATSISAETLKKMLDKLDSVIWLTWYPSDDTPSQNDTGLFVRWDNQAETMRLVRGDGTAVSGSDFAFTVRVINHDKRSGDGMRCSAAAYYHLHPYLITYWNFPLMGVYEGSGL